MKFIGELEAILANDQLLRQVSSRIAEVKRIRRRAEKRKSWMLGVELRIEDLIPDEEVAITVRMPATSNERRFRFTQTRSRRSKAD
jgi:hypothetical protein